jgi:hypothetical protein
MVEISPPSIARDIRDVITSEWVGALFPHNRLEVGGNRRDEQITLCRAAAKLCRSAEQPPVLAPI